jgi:hypothetical protein
MGQRAMLREPAAVLSIERLCCEDRQGRSNRTAISLSAHDSLFHAGRRSNQGANSAKMREKVHAQMESRIRSFESSCVSPGGRYDLLGERYDLQASVLTVMRGAINTPA